MLATAPLGWTRHREAATSASYRSGMEMVALVGCGRAWQQWT